MVPAIPLEEDISMSTSNANNRNKANMPKAPSKPRHVPEALRSPSSQIEMLRARIRIFWLLRFLMLFLTRYDSELNRVIKTNPMVLDERPVESWTEG